MKRVFTQHSDRYLTSKPEDLEKDETPDVSENESDPPSSASSRRTSSSNSSNYPMLSPKILSYRRRSLRNRFSLRCARYLGLALILILVIFIFHLYRASVISSRQVAIGNIGIRPAPPPEVWKSFPFLSRYYGGLRSLTPTSEITPEYPLREDEDFPSFENLSVPTHSVPPSKPFEAYKKDISNINITDSSPIQKCYLYADGKTVIPSLQYYQGRPYGFPENIIGSYEVLGLPENICFERYGRFGPYGYGYAVKYGGTGTGEFGDKEGFKTVWNNGSESNQIDYRNVDWGDTQRRCYDANKARFESEQSVIDKLTFPTHSENLDFKMLKYSNKTLMEKTLLKRTAVVIRVWDDFEYHEEDIMNLRAMISELSIGSGGEYDVHLLVQVRNEAANPIWADSDYYQKHLNRSVPREFRGITTLWSETQMLALYQGLFDGFTRGPEYPIHGSYRGLQMAIQYFAHKHPEYDFFWHWEIDIRYTGHYYHLFSQIESWSAKQPRKGLWERSSRFYIPSVHGSWEDFKHMVRVQTEIGTQSPDKIWSSLEKNEAAPTVDKPIWGPERPQHEEDWFETDNDPLPPSSYEKDKYEWGVGESADLITFNPFFDPEKTTWLLANDITGYNTSEGLPARRAAIVSTARMSKRLLRMMHRETAFKNHHAFAEMWAPTVALHHGYKAVYVPHPMFVDRKWPTGYFSGILNAGRNGATGGARTCVFGAGEHNLYGLTWAYNAGFPVNLWKRWLGLKVNNDGGIHFETTIDESKDQRGVDGMRGGEGRMCLPPMLLHPVKNVRMPVESITVEKDLPLSNPID